MERETPAKAGVFSCQLKRLKFFRLEVEHPDEVIVGVGDVYGVSRRGNAQGMLKQRRPEGAVPVSEIEQSASDQRGDFPGFRVAGAKGGGFAVSENQPLSQDVDSAG